MLGNETTARRSVLVVLLFCLAVAWSPLSISAGRAISQPASEIAAQQDDGLVAFLREGNLWLMNGEGSDQRPVTEYAEEVLQYAWSPSGRYLAIRREAQLSLYDTATSDLRDLASLPGGAPGMRGAFGSTFSWAADADQLMLDVAEDAGLHNLIQLDLDGVTTRRASYDQPSICSGMDGPAPVTAILLDGYERGSALVRGAYEGMIWWADRDVAFVNTECIPNISINLTNGSITEYPDTAWLAGKPDGTVLIQDSTTTNASSLAIFDPATGAVVPLDIGYEAPYSVGPFAWAHSGDVVFATTTEGPESSFSFVFDDVPPSYHDNTTEIWSTGPTAAPPTLLAALDVFDAGIPSVANDGTIVVGIVDNPTEMLDVDQTQADPSSLGIFAEHQKVVKIDPAGSVSVLATNAYRPRLQPAGTAAPIAEPTNTTAEVATATALPTQSGEVSTRGWIAYAGSDGNIWLTRPDGAERLQVTTDGSPDRPYLHPSWSPDGKMLVFSTRNAEEEAGNDIYLLRDGAVTRVPGIHNCNDAAFTPDGLHLALLCAAARDSSTVPPQQWFDSTPADGFVSIVNLDGSNWQVLAPYQVQVDGSDTLWWTMLRTYDLSISPVDGEMLVNTIFWSSARYRQIHLIDSEGAWDTTFSMPSGDAGRVWGSFAADGANILARLCRGCYKDSPGPSDTSIALLDRSGNLIETLYTPDANVVIGSFAQSPDGDFLLVSSTTAETDLDFGTAGLPYTTQLVDLASGTVTDVPIDGSGFSWQPAAAEIHLPGDSANLQPTTTFVSNAPIIAITCTTSSEGFWISGGGGMNMPEGCACSNGTVFSVSGPNGEQYGSCAISDFFCDGAIWMPTDVEVTVTLDESTIPAGYAVVDGNPKHFTLPATKIGSDSEQWLFVSMPADIAEAPAGESPDTPAIPPDAVMMPVPIVAITCSVYADQFYSNQGIGFELPDGCVFASGASFAVTDANGNPYGSCVTNEFGSCNNDVLLIPVDVGVVVTQDSATIPEGYVVSGGNPQTCMYPSIAIGTEGPQWLFVTMPGSVVGGEPASSGALMLDPGSNWIAYIGSDGNLWLMLPDGSGQMQVTFDGSADAWYESPSWSHDGTMLVFTRPAAVPGGISQVYLIANGTVAAIPGVYGCNSAAFMPGDQQIAMTCGRDGDESASAQTLQSDPSMGLVSIANLDGSDWHVRATFNQGDTKVWPTLGTGPGATTVGSVSVTPDGTIYFGYSTQMSSGMAFVRPDSGNVEQFVSPQGTGAVGGIYVDAAEAFLFAHCRGCYIHSQEDPQFSVGWMDRDGTVTATLLTPDPTLRLGNPTISPDGGTLVYTVAEGNYPFYGSIQARDLASGSETTIASGMEPAWQPNPGVAMLATTFTAQVAPTPATTEQIQPVAGATMPAIDATAATQLFIGIWDGIGIQENPHGEWPIGINITGGELGEIVGTSLYLEQSCGGNLILQDVSDTEMVLLEQLTYGQEACADNGTIVLSGYDGVTIQFTWNGIGPNGTPSSASGRLGRPDNAAPADSTTVDQGASSSGVALPDTFVGTTWTGTGLQENPANTWTVTISLTGGSEGEIIGTIDYPNLGCGGEIILAEVNTEDNFGSFWAQERITYGQDNCIDGGRFLFFLSEGAFLLNFQWTSPIGPTTATGQLEPV